MKEDKSVRQVRADRKEELEGFSQRLNDIDPASPSGLPSPDTLERPPEAINRHTNRLCKLSKVFWPLERHSL